MTPDRPPESQGGNKRHFSRLALLTFLAGLLSCVVSVAGLLYAYSSLFLEGPSGYSFLAAFVLSVVVLILGAWSHRRVDRNHEKMSGAWLAMTGILLASLGLVVYLSYPGFAVVCASNARAKDRRNLQQLGIALHGYANDHDDRFPPPAILSRAGAPLLSWRVAILPYLGEEDLYHRFRLDEPWDSDHNKNLLPLMPAVFIQPAQRAGKGMTHYQVFVGPRTAFGHPQGRSLKTDFKDGTSNCLLIVPAQKAVPWTKPEDMTYDPDRPLPEFKDRFYGGNQVLFADGSVSWFPFDMPEANWRAFIVIDDGLLGWPENQGLAPGSVSCFAQANLVVPFASLHRWSEKGQRERVCPPGRNGTKDDRNEREGDNERVGRNAIDHKGRGLFSLFACILCVFASWREISSSPSPGERSCPRRVTASSALAGRRLPSASGCRGTRRPRACSSRRNQNRCPP